MYMYIHMLAIVAMHNIIEVCIYNNIPLTTVLSCTIVPSSHTG